MTTHEGRLSLDAKAGDILVRDSGHRFRVVDVRTDEEGTYFVMRPVEEKPAVRTWWWVTVSAIASAALTYWWLI